MAADGTQKLSSAQGAFGDVPNGVKTSPSILALKAKHPPLAGVAV